MYQLGQGDLDVPYPKRDPSANLPSEEEDKDLDEDGSESDRDKVSGDEESYESPLRIVVGLDGLRNFILPLI